MEPLDVIRDIQQTGVAEQPWSVLVQRGTVKDVLRPEEAEETGAAVRRLAQESGESVAVYAVDSRLPHPPPVGTPVDPPALGWLRHPAASA
jgi:hypothetical protein